MFKDFNFTISFHGFQCQSVWHDPYLCSSLNWCLLTQDFTCVYFLACGCSLLWFVIFVLSVYIKPNLWFFFRLFRHVLFFVFSLCFQRSLLNSRNMISGQYAALPLLLSLLFFCKYCCQHFSSLIYECFPCTCLLFRFVILMLEHLPIVQ